MNAQTQSVTRIENPLSSGQNQIVHRNQSGSALISTESQRAIAEVQAALAIAKSFPRDRVAAVDRILNDCQRSGLAQVAVYQYSRGGTSINGPTIRLAESLAQNWGNIQYGVRELSQANGESTVEAFAWDVETNTRQTKIFQVPHVRYTKSGGAVKLVDPRDIYEAVANNGARRLRACILGVIPGDVVEAALQQCDLTLNTFADTSPEGIQKIIRAFENYGVTKEALEKRIQCRMEAIKPAQIVSLTKIGTSLKEGMSSPADWFEMGSSSGVSAQGNKGEPSDFAVLKHQILTIKSIDELNVCEEQVMDHANKDERKQLMQLIKAQAKKFNPPSETEKQVEPKAEEVAQVDDVQNTTSNDVAKKPTSTEVRKEYLDQIANFTHTKDLQTIIPLIKGHEILTDAHKTYLVNAVNQKIEDLNKAAQAQKPAGVDKIKSQSLVNGLKTMVNEAQNMADLQLVVEKFNGSKAKIDPAHAQDFLSVYAQRKAFLEDQLSMFDEAPVQQESYADRAIARIYAAKNQDDINAEFIDPEFEEQSDQDKHRITIAAQEREQQLLG